MVGIVLLNYNNWNLSINCIRSIRATTDIPYKIYIVDNASTDKMTDVFIEFIGNAKDCQLIISEYNNGYSAGNNLGIKRALEDKCDFVLVSNNDVIFRAYSIEIMQNYLESHKKYGIVGPKVFLQSGEIQEINFGCKMTISGKYKYLLRKTPLRSLVNKFIQEFHSEDKNKTKDFDVYAVSGCCFMMSFDIAKELYPLDENVFLYEEENIIGHKMEKLNKKTAYIVESEIVHLGGASTEGMSQFAYVCFIRSEQYYCKVYLNAKWIQIMPLLCIRVLIGIKNYGLDIIKVLKRK